MDNGSKLEGYLLLAKGARGLALADLIQKVTAEPGIFTFGELLDVPSVKELENSEASKAHKLLQLFAYGTWSDYKGNASSLPALNDQQLLKLRQLTVVSIAENKKSIAYGELLQQLELGNIRELEDLLITDCFHSGIIKGKLDQRAQRLQIHESIARDVRPEQLQPILDSVATWMGTCNEMAEALEERMRWMLGATEAAEKAKAAADARIEAAKTAVKSDPDPRGQEGMLLDEPVGPSMDHTMEEDRIGFGSGRPKRRR
ncbi:COP9 signalosome complex subunit 7a [Coccomyxa sp. Obi]|nr:COP9 signalosome complex subunit 7a [Coccomyxa sp. Obi]